MKPPYSLPTMTEIAAIPKNAGTVVSTFSGCGGSCLGFEQAGFQVLWANEFIPSARETYEANHPGVIVDGSDIRTVTGAQILEAIGKQRGEVDVVEGSPPCASFSVSGKRHKHWQAVKKYSETKQRTDDLFFEFIRLIDEIQPRVFVAENVKGLVTGVAKGYFKIILAAMREIGYTVKARVLDAQWLGVPQHRERVIFVGVRDDLAKPPAFPRPVGYRYSISEAWETLNGQVIESEAWIGKYAIGKVWDRLAIGESSHRLFNLVRPLPARPSPTIVENASHPNASSVTHPTERRKFSVAETKRLCGFPDDFVLRGTYQQQIERIGRAVPPPMMYAVARTIRDEILTETP